jgi:peptidoglycan-associated lipoprotein
MNNKTVKMGFVAATLFVACAHKQPVPVSQEPAPPAPAVKEAAAPPPTCPEGTPCQGDLMSALRETTVNFDFDRATLTPLSEGRLQVLADVLKKYPSAHIAIAGNCDERGTDEYNLHLGQQRAAAAKRYLVSLGIDDARIDTISYGFHRPVDERHNEEAWAMNRRDDFSVKAVNTAAVSKREDQP